MVRPAADALRRAPATLHLTFQRRNGDGLSEQIAHDLADATAAARASGPAGPSRFVAAAGSLDPATLDDAAFDGLLALAGLSAEAATSPPERMAPLNALLDALPPVLREALLLGVIDRLARPSLPMPSPRP